MADDVIYDEQGHARHFRVARDPTGGAALAAAAASTPQEAARNFLTAQASVLQVPQDAMRTLDVRSAIAPTAENQALRFESETHLMDTAVVSYSQTMFGLPIYQAGISVTVRTPDNSVQAASSTLHYDILAQPPGDSLAGLTGRVVNAAAVGGYDELGRRAIPAASAMRINRTRLMVYPYDAATRTSSHPKEDTASGFHTEPPTLPLPPVPPSIVDGTYYVVVEMLFSLPIPDLGMLNWRAFVEPESGAVLFLRALVDGVTGLVRMDLRCTPWICAVLKTSSRP